MNNELLECLINVLEDINNNLEEINESMKQISECVHEDGLGRKFMHIGGIMSTYTQ